MKKKIISSIILTILLLSFTLIFFIQDKKTFSSNENRYLASFPSFSFSELESGEYTENIKNYLSDHFPFRDTFMSIKTKFEQLLGKDDINNVYIGKDEYLLEQYKKPVNSNKIINTLNNLYQNLNYTNMNLMLVPTSITINSDKLPNNAITESQIKEINYIYDNIKFDTIDVIEPLKNANNEYQTYYRLDHHWTTYGAYYAYLEYCKLNEINEVKISDFEIQEVTKDFNGTLYSKTNIYDYTPDKIHIFKYKNDNYEVNYVMSKKITTSLYEESHLNTKDKYSYFLDNNHPLIEITNKNLNNNKELLVIKDSYANSFIPFLTNHYEKIHVIDPRFYKMNISEYVKNNQNIKDILILYNMNTIDNDLGILTIK